MFVETFFTLSLYVRLKSISRAIRSDSDFNREQMEIKRTTDIFVRTRRRFTIPQPEPAEQTVCSQCSAQMFAAEQIAVIFGVGCRAVYRLVEAGAAHFAETEAGAVMICHSSLEAAIYGSAKQLPETNSSQILETGEKNEK
jgi:hypothetical protein